MARSTLSIARSAPNISFAGVPCAERTVGFLPYGSSDSSVILQHPLTTLPTAAELDVATVAELDSAITFDSNGMLLGTNRLRFTTLSNSDAAARTKLTKQGQLSFQIQKEGICGLGTTTNGSTSTGDAFINQFITQLRGGTSELYIRLNSTTQVIDLTSVTPTATSRSSFFDTAVSASPAISTVGKSDYVTVNIAWDSDRNDGFLILGIDDVPVRLQAFTGFTGGDIGSVLDWNSRTGAANVEHTRYIKNIQISNVAPCFPYSPDLGTIVVWGDSQPEGYEALYAGAQFDADMGHTINRKLWANGIFTRKNQVIVVDNGGDSFANHTTGALSTNADASYTADIVGNSPRVVVWEWATNDVASDATFNTTNFTAALVTNVDAIMALSSVEQLILLTVPSLIGDSAQYAETNNAANLAAANAAINAQPARWAAANPSSTKEVVVVDLYTLLGGDTTGNNYWVGEVKTTLGDFHHTDKAHYLKGNAVATEIIRYYNASRAAA